MKAFVAGATGQTGRRIVQELVNRDVPVRAFVRNLQTAKEILPSSVELVVGDVLNSDCLRDAIADCTILVCAIGATPSIDLTSPYRVDYLGTKNLIDAAKIASINHFLLVSSLCVSQFFHPLNLFGLILYWKQQAEIYLKNSGLTYTIVRPGGLKNTEVFDPLIMKSADQLFEGSLSRTQVAQVSVESLFAPNAVNKIVEIIAQSDAPQKSLAELFQGI